MIFVIGDRKMNMEISIKRFYQYLDINIMDINRDVTARKAINVKVKFF